MGMATDMQTLDQIKTEAIDLVRLISSSFN